MADYIKPMQAAAMSLVSAATLMIGAAKTMLVNPTDGSGPALVARYRMRTWLCCLVCFGVHLVVNRIHPSCRKSVLVCLPSRFSHSFPAHSIRYRESVNTALRSLLIALKAARDAKMNGSKMM